MERGDLLRKKNRKIELTPSGSQRIRMGMEPTRVITQNKIRGEIDAENKKQVLV